MTQETIKNGPRVVVEALDPQTLCIRASAAFVVLEPRKFCGIALIDNLAEIENTPWRISSTQLGKLKSQFCFELEDVESDELTVRGWHWLDELPYKTHTRREITMMLQGKKPLAIFSVFTPEGQEDEVFAEQVFDEHVKEGVFVKYQKHVVDEAHPNGPISIRQVYYALKAEE